MANDRDDGIEHTPKNPSPVEEPSSQTDGGQDGEPSVEVPAEILAGVPKEHHQAIVRAFSSVTQFAAPVLNPIFQRITSDHVSRIIDNIENDRVREDNADKSRMRYQFWYFILGVGVIVGLIVFFTVSDNRDMIIPIIGVVAGFLGGYTTGRYFHH